MLGALVLVAPGGEDTAPPPAQGNTPQPTPVVAPSLTDDREPVGVLRPAADTGLLGR